MSNKLTVSVELPWRTRALLAESEERRLRAEVEQLTEEANDLDSKLGSALRAIGLEHAENAQLNSLNTEHWNALRAMADDYNAARDENEQLHRSLSLYEREIDQLRAENEQLAKWRAEEKEQLHLVLVGLDLANAENERLKNEVIRLDDLIASGPNYVDEIERLRAEVARLRAVIDEIASEDDE